MIESYKVESFFNNIYRINFRGNLIDLEIRDIESHLKCEFDGIAFKYTATIIDSYYTDGRPSIDEDTEYFYCDKWAYRSAYLWFSNSLSDDGVLNGDDLLLAADIYRVVEDFIEKLRITLKDK